MCKNRLTVLNSRVIERRSAGTNTWGQGGDHSWASYPVMAALVLQDLVLNF